MQSWGDSVAGLRLHRKITPVSSPDLCCRGCFSSTTAWVRTCPHVPRSGHHPEPRTYPGSRQGPESPCSPGATHGAASLVLVRFADKVPLCLEVGAGTHGAELQCPWQAHLVAEARGPREGLHGQ